MTVRSRIQLGALDFSPLSKGCSAEAVVRESIASATVLEELGYSRLWFGEHHEPTVAHSSPSILIALAAAATRSIRIGSGGILLNLYEPLRVANDFALLETLFPNRIDLGVARGTPSAERRAHLAASAVEPGFAFRAYASKLASLVSIVERADPIAPNPPVRSGPQIWALGSSEVSAVTAAELGISYCHACFLDTSPEKLKRVSDAFRAASTEGPFGGRFAVAVAGTCATLEATARAYVAAHVSPFIHPTVAGTPSACADALEALQHSCGASELLFLDISPSHATRLTSYELLAGALQLVAPAADAH